MNEQIVEKWDVFEVVLAGKSEGNPFTDYNITGRFVNEKESVDIDGFYDGKGIYRVRFMPSYEGEYTYRIEGNFSDNIMEGYFKVTAPKKEKNHGPVKVVNQVNLEYEDGTPYYSIGTTCYAWVHQTLELQEKTLKTLKSSPFNKVRFCIYPKYYEYNKKEPFTYPYDRGDGTGIDKSLLEKEKREQVYFPGQQETEYDLKFNYYSFNVEHFQRFDKRIKELCDLGIEADIILMHPYDRWGMKMMDKESCDLYIRYVVARFSSYRNIWWSLANEYDLIITKTEEDFERYAKIICERDPYKRMKSIHNCLRFYDYSRSWITHCSMQRIDFYRHVEYTDEYIDKYQKPVIWDEVGYEGNIWLGWGNLTPQEMVRRFWEAFLRGGYAGHGETYEDEQDILWWSHGGEMKGESHKRLSFLLNILKEIPGKYIRRSGDMLDIVTGAADNGKEDELYELHYMGINQPAFRIFFLPDNVTYQVDVIDTWEMTITSHGVHNGISRIKLPQRPYIAVRIKGVR